MIVVPSSKHGTAGTSQDMTVPMYNIEHINGETRDYKIAYQKLVAVPFHQLRHKNFEC